MKWLQEGERNTKFFHNSVIKNRNSTRIQKLKTRNGNRVDTRREIETELTQYFSDILREEVGNRSREIEKNHQLNSQFGHYRKQRNVGQAY